MQVDAQIIRRVDRYELLEEVGVGGMAVVYRGRDTALDREVAVKVLHPHLAARAESRARFSREARAVARLGHPNIVEIYDYAGDGALESYLVTEFVRGRTLRRFAEEEAPSLPEVGALVTRALADALVHAHAAGVIHRDLKPENVLVLETPGRRAVKLVDFGIARILASEERMTMTGALVGSPNHMAPEILEGREADARSDLFSLGTILYWLSVGRMPFAAPNPTATLRRVIDGDYEDPRAASPRMTDELAGVIAGALQPDPDARTPTAEALRDALDAALAASGLADAEAELSAFLSDARGYQDALRARLVEHALRRADAALAAGEAARAMRAMDRVLALDPQNAPVLARLAAMERRAQRRRTLRRAGAVAAAVALLAGAAWGGERWRRGTAARTPPARAAAVSAAPGRASSTSEAPPATPPASPTSTATSTATSPAGPTAPGSSSPAPSSPRPSPSPRVASASSAAGAPAARAGPPVQVVAFVRPYAQRALLDGSEIARGEQRVRFALAPGAPHRLQIEHACCVPFVREFSATEALPPLLELKVPLVARPGRLRVDADAETLVFVDERAAGTAEESLRTPIEVAVPGSGETPYERHVQLRLERDGAPAVRTTLRVRAGADVTFAAPPSARPTPGPGPAEPSPAPARTEVASP